MSITLEGSSQFLRMPTSTILDFVGRKMLNQKTVMFSIRPDSPKTIAACKELGIKHEDIKQKLLIIFNS